MNGQRRRARRRWLAGATLCAGWLLPGCSEPDSSQAVSGPVSVIRLPPDLPLDELPSITTIGGAANRAVGGAVDRAVGGALDRAVGGALDRAVGGALNRAVASTPGPLRIELLPGHYVLAPESYDDPSCGNCEDPETVVPATVGLRIAGSQVTLTGAHPDSVFIHTRAGYGILFDGCQACGLRGVTVTGGVRDLDGRATDGGVVVRESSVTLQRCAILDNVGDSATISETVVGVAGVVGREGGFVDVRGCRIAGNSWDGVALYRDSEAVIRGNVIDGVDQARGTTAGGGRGVGVGVTWNAKATIEENLIRRYWKGVGVFLDGRAEIRENVVEDMLTWGIALWSDGGHTVAHVEDNVVFRTGACGVLVDLGDGAEEPGTLSNNLIVQTGMDPAYDGGEPYCPQQPIARVRVPAGFAIENNMFHANRVPGPAADAELTLEELIQKATNLYTFHIEPQAATNGSAFMQEFAPVFGQPFR